MNASTFSLMKMKMREIHSTTICEVIPDHVKGHGLEEYNKERPHEALGGLTPAEHLMEYSPEISTYDWY